MAIILTWVKATYKKVEAQKALLTFLSRDPLELI